MDFFDGIKFGDAPLWIVGYYFLMWAINTFGYGLASYSFYQLAKLTKESRLYRMLANIAALLFVFMLIRGLSGIVSFVFFSNGTSNSTETIEIMGVVSLFLNTFFINSFAVVAYFETRRLKAIKRNKIELFHQGLKTFERLREATDKVRNATP